MSTQDVFTTSTEKKKTNQLKITGSEVVEFGFNSAVFMVSPHPERGNALALTMQGQSMAIQVATLLTQGGSVSEAIWETPFSGRPPEWQEALLSLVDEHAGPALLAFTSASGSSVGGGVR